MVFDPIGKIIGNQKKIVKDMYGRDMTELDYEWTFTGRPSQLKNMEMSSKAMGAKIIKVEKDKDRYGQPIVILHSYGGDDNKMPDIPKKKLGKYGFGGPDKVE